MQWTISQSDCPAVIRDFLHRKKGISSKLLAKLKRQPDGILLNGAPVFVNAQLQPGDILFVDCETGEDVSSVIPSALPVDVLYEDDYIRVLNKPPFMPTHPSLNHPDDSLANAVAYMEKDSGVPFVFRPASRLDRNTSGVILTAKNQYCASLLSAQMKAGTIHKTYLAILTCRSGSLPAEEGFLQFFMARKNESMVERCIVGENEKDAVYALTAYRILSRSDDGSMLLVQATPVTGRTHQLRVQFAHYGCPVLGDDLYGTPSSLISRQALHASNLSFPHPIFKSKMEIEAPLPEDMAGVISSNFTKTHID